eukprot:1838140-Pleurochrysis_carterae.AAC.1
MWVKSGAYKFLWLPEVSCSGQDCDLPKPVCTTSSTKDLFRMLKVSLYLGSVWICRLDGGVIYVFEKSEDKEYYKRAKSFRIENNAVKIKNLAVSVRPDNACFG